MKFSKEILKALGLESAGDDVTEAQVLAAIKQLSDNAAPAGVDIAELKQKAELADKFMEAKRVNVTRLAKLSELGAEEGTLDEAVSQSIDGADSFERLQVLETYYEKQVAKKFQKGRSSQEDPTGVHQAGGVEQTTAGKKPVKNIRVH